MSKESKPEIIMAHALGRAFGKAKALDSGSLSTIAMVVCDVFDALQATNDSECIRIGHLIFENTNMVHRERKAYYELKRKSIRDRKEEY